MADDFARSRFRRALSLSKLGARVAIGQGKRLIARDEADVHRELAATLVGELGKLKGLPMKIGQILSYMDGVVPEEYEAIYQDLLGQLRTHSQPMSAQAWRAVFEEELGRTPEEVFDSFEPEPIASASIGQVHRAVLDGVAVCFKVQYPGVAEATAADLENIETIVALMRRVMPKIDTRQMVHDFRDRLAEECDYRIEASYQRRFADIYRDHETLMVPGVIDHLSTRRILTTVFVQGVGLDSFVASASAAERDRAGAALYRFAFGSLLRHGLFHADPHPGNLLFDADGTGKLCVLDYGCVQPIDEAARRDIAALLRAALAGRGLEAPARLALGITEMDEATGAAVTEIVEHVLSPITNPQPHRFTRAFAADISRAVIEAKASLASRYVTRRGVFKADREGVMFVVRNLFGLATLWGTLEARGDFRALTRELLEESVDLRHDALL